jgi:hypothetical protein
LGATSELVSNSACARMFAAAFFAANANQASALPMQSMTANF